jgi:hypothetical protein
MSNTTGNTFKAGDKITLTPRSEPLSQLLTLLIKGHTNQTEFTLTTVGLATHNDLEEHLKQPSPEPDAVAFKCDDCDKEFECHYLDISLAE